MTLVKLVQPELQVQKMGDSQIVFRGDRLRQLRRRQNLSQDALAAELTTEDEEITQTHISRWERGAYNPLLPTTRRIARYFKVSVDYLVEEVDTPQGVSPLRNQAWRNLKRAAGNEGPKPSENGT